MLSWSDVEEIYGEGVGEMGVGWHHLALDVNEGGAHLYKDGSFIPLTLREGPDAPP